MRPDDRPIETEATPMSEDELVKILRDEELDAATFYTAEIATAQATALDRYHARPLGDELEDRSKVVTHDIEDTVNWIMPGLMRTFAPSDELITCDDPALDDDDKTLVDASSYLNHIFFNDNAGEEIIHDFAFDGLLQRIGVIRVGWDNPRPEPAKVMEGVTSEQLMKYAHDPEYEIISIAVDGEFDEEAEGEGPDEDDFGMSGDPQMNMSMEGEGH